ncbi:DoxX family protein [Sinomonas mesophila]|uniref:DoxX family protein n=1 Tax=Sinomonas mesophila TaxID=1531955 RepID=UPI0009862FD7|nr:DoxX family protein [Sinomonas mesophila]
MFIAAAILSVLFSAVLAFSAVGKIRKDPHQMAVLEVVKATTAAPLLAALELAAAAGLLAGLVWWPIGIAAGIGAVLYFAGAIIAHLRVGDRAVSASVVLLGVSVGVVVLRALPL